MDTQALDVLGAVTALVILVSSIVTFALRFVADTGTGHWSGIPILVAALPLAYLVLRAPGADRPALYYVQVGLMLGWIVLLFLLDYWPGTDWRDVRWQLITVVTLYFAGLGGMIGISFLAGRAWGIAAVVAFFAAGILAFVQRAVTGI